MNLNNLRPGDLLYRKKGVVEHAGIYLGSEQVFHNSPDNDVEVVSFEKYAAGKEVKVIHKSIDDPKKLSEQLELILTASKKYSVVSYNCEHIANLLIMGRAHSPQIAATTIGAVIMGILAKDKGMLQMLGWGVLGGVIGCLVSNSMRKYDGSIVDHKPNKSVTPN